MSFWARDWWRTRSDFHRLFRGTKSFVRSIAEEVSSAPKRTLFDVLTGLPIASLAIPKFREWLFKLPYATPGVLALVALRVVFGAWRRGAMRRVLREEAGKALQRVMPVIECSRIHVDAQAQRQRLPPAQIQRNVETVLSAIVDLAGQALHVSPGVRLGANLMMPMMVHVSDEGAPRAGCGIVAYHSMPASPSWTRLVMGDFGAGRVFQSGRVQAVEDTTDPVWCGLFKDSRSKCFASFPVRSGSAVVIAVVNIDADRPMVVTRKLAEALFADVLSPALKLLGDLLVAVSSVPIPPEGSHADRGS